MKPLIKDENVRECVKKWADINEIIGDDKLSCDIFDFDHGGFFKPDAVITFSFLPARIGLQFWNEGKIIDKKCDGKSFSIIKLCGE